MNVKTILFITFLLIIALVGSTITGIYYRQLAIRWESTAQQNIQALEVAKTQAIKQQQSQQDFALLDKKYTEELYSAQVTIKDLRDAVAAGNQRLQLNAHCPNSTTSPPSSANVASPRLTHAAERHYWDLRQRISIADKQIAGLQNYIRMICLK